MSLVELVHASTQDIEHNHNPFYGYAEAITNFVKKHKFADGFTLENRDELAYLESDGFWWKYTGSLPVTVPAGFSPVGTTVHADWTCVGALRGYHYQDARNFGMVGDDSTDNSTAFEYLLKIQKGKCLYTFFPKGIYRFTRAQVITDARFTFEGAGSLQTAFRSAISGTHSFFKIDAWPNPTDPNQPYLDAVNLRGLHFEGNSSTSVTLEVQGIARSIWEDVSVWGAASNGTCIRLKSVQLCRFSNLMSSKYRNLVGQTVNVPQLCMEMTVGTRAGAGQGSPSNNNFVSLYMEGAQRGLNMVWGDNNQFIGGSCEAHSDYGTNITAACRYNTFIGMGNENLNATTADFINRGRYTKFLNCYSSQRFVEGGFNSTVDGGYFQLLEVQSNAIGATIQNLAVSNWNVGASGLVDEGSGTRKRSIYDMKLSQYLNTSDTRTIVTLSTTPVSGGTRGTWQNSTRLPVQLVIQGSANITAITLDRAGDAWTMPNSSTQQIRLEPLDTISITWSSSGSAPSVSYRRLCEG